MLILASQSKSRQELLEDAGVDFKSVSSGVDEDAIKKEMRSNGRSSLSTSLQLATAKAMAVSKKYPKAYVIGADQILDLNGEWFEKPTSMNMAHKHLKKLRDKTHQLVNGTVIVKKEKVLWSDNAVINVTFRNFSDNFLDYYLAEAGEDICHSVGAYYLEDLGAQLVKNMEGDYFSVLGLPLLPLLEMLRSFGELER